MNVKYKLYRHYDSEDNLLYVGISTNLTSRLAAHRAYSEWFDKITTIKIETYKNLSELRNIEKKIILEEKPVFNILHNIEQVNKRDNDFLSLYELADYLKIFRGRVRMELQLNRFPITPDKEKPYAWIKKNVKIAMKNSSIKTYLFALRSK
jgi:predicted GIY-YIG superfamily endonuclease